MANTKIMLKLAVNRLPAIRNSQVTFDTVTDAMHYVERAEALSQQLRLDAVALRRAIRLALDDDPALSFGEIAPPVADEDGQT